MPLLDCPADLMESEPVVDILKEKVSSVKALLFIEYKINTG